MLEKCASVKPAKHDCFQPKLSAFQLYNMDFETSEVQPKTPMGSGLTNALKRGTQQGFKVSADLNPLYWKSTRVQNQPNEIVSDRNLADLKFKYGLWKPKISYRNSPWKWADQPPKQGYWARFQQIWTHLVGKVHECKTRQTRLFSTETMQIWRS